MDKDNNEVPYMRSLSYCLNKYLEQGYKENFQAGEDGLYSLETHRKYSPEDIHVVDFYRFEGVSDPADNSILYIIETPDGAKGTLVDAYGAYADPRIDKIMRQVEDIQRQ